MCGEGGSGESNWEKRGEDPEYFQQQQKKFITGLFVIADLKAHGPALFIRHESRVAMATITRIQGTN